MSRKSKYNTVHTGGRLERVAFPIGGIGAGMICLEGSGMLSHVSLRHRPELLHEPLMFAALHVCGHGAGSRGSVTRILEGPVPTRKACAMPDSGIQAWGKNYGLPRFASASFKARFPFGTVGLIDDDVPVGASITGWSPFIPNDADNSSLPVAALEYRFVNPSSKRLHAVLSFHAANFMARSKDTAEAPRPIDGGFVLPQSAFADDPAAEGCFAAFVDEPARVDCAWFRGGWFDTLTMLWKDIESGATKSRGSHTQGRPSEGASLYVPFELPPRSSRIICLHLCWYVPRSSLRAGGAAAGASCGGGCCSGSQQPQATYEPWYAGRFGGIGEVARYWRDNYATLRQQSQAFSDCFYDTALPPEVVEAVAANLTILKSPTCLRQKDGRLWAWEGSDPFAGCCAGTCTHVWNYAQALPHLFSSLERSLRQTELRDSQDDRGHQAFRASLPIGQADHGHHAAADGQLGGLLKLYREWRISGDTRWLASLWPAAKASLDYCIATWDPNRQGLLVEPHHNTYDIEFWGADGMCGSIYLGALAAAAQMGRACGADVSEYRKLLRRGKAAMDRQLWNGQYFQQKVQWQGLRAGDPAAQQAWNVNYSPEAVEIMRREGPKYQYGSGCLSDGVIGDWLARVCGLAPVLDRSKVAGHLRSVYRHNFRRSLRGHVNPQRPQYALANEGGLLLCSWPRVGKPTLPFVYSDEVWTGIEYQVASHLIMMGMVREGLEIVRTARHRYDGTRRNPFDECECGHWYARAMSSYALLGALSGARYDAVTKTLHLAPRIKGDFRAFLCTATGYGTVGVRKGKPFLEVKSGDIDIRQIEYQRW